MNDGNILSIAQLQNFLSGVGAISFNINQRGNENKQAMYDWVGNLLARVRYFSSPKKDRSIVIKYVQSITGLSRGHIKKLIRKAGEKGIPYLIKTNLCFFFNCFISSFRKPPHVAFITFLPTRISL